MPQNGWYDDDSQELRRGLRAAEARGEITHRQAQRRMKSLIHRKKREWEERRYWELYHLLMSRDSGDAWRCIRERGCPTPIHDPHLWHDYAERLYQIPGQPPIPTPQRPSPTTASFFTSHMNTPLLELMQKIGSNHNGKSVSQVALSYLIMKGAIPIPGCKSESQARSLCELLDWGITINEVVCGKLSMVAEVASYVCKQMKPIG
ncbi:hypothetical protein L7F22_012523 [Adiantum nelumboides]|nr:hypothetical protein [Adiantum nelumboides]